MTCPVISILAVFLLYQVKTPSLFLLDNLVNKSNSSSNGAQWVGAGPALGVTVFAITNEPTWIAVGIAIGSVLSWRMPKIQNED